MSVIKSYYMLENIKFTSFTVSELLKENQQIYSSIPHQIKVKRTRT